jgi:hypothetical protein
MQVMMEHNIATWLRNITTWLWEVGHGEIEIITFAIIKDELLFCCQKTILARCVVYVEQHVVSFLLNSLGSNQYMYMNEMDHC